MSKNPKGMITLLSILLLIADVLAYMTRENRPFSVNDIVTALQKAHGKTVISKAVDELVLDASLVEKVYGKQKVFVVSQVRAAAFPYHDCEEKLPRPDSSELKAMDDKINELTTNLQQLRDRVRVVESELKSVQSSLSLQEARDQNAVLEIKIGEIKKLISEYGSEPPVPPEEFSQAMDIVDAVAEGYPKSRKELMDDVGIETDEDRGVSIADFTF
ncbi:unnamed protein product [Hydatigera taeniaeformis]|uniref:Homologous-pairing protein 2 homolog n=1 Tax=Hydatigena taeniaeformis TaxID=6205 RepID=A0A0R3WPF8_HYDTA|nr:unnamed protein product [Hydatigera taeniaeformis]